MCPVPVDVGPEGDAADGQPFLCTSSPVSTRAHRGIGAARAKSLAKRTARVSGARTKASIEATNSGEGWSRALCRVYEQAFQVPRRVADRAAVEAPCFDDVDVFWPFIFGTALKLPPPVTRLTAAREAGLKTLPPARGLQAWAGMAWRQEFSRPLWMAWRSLLPDWLAVSICALYPATDDGSKNHAFGDSADFKCASRTTLGQ